jgi:hypothetical protein
VVKLQPDQGKERRVQQAIAATVLVVSVLVLAVVFNGGAPGSTPETAQTAVSATTNSSPTASVSQSFQTAPAHVAATTINGSRGSFQYLSKPPPSNRTMEFDVRGNVTPTPICTSCTISGPTTPATSILDPYGVSIASNNFVSDGSEPAAANNGNTVFYTANWFAARSLDGGTTWSFLDPIKVNFGSFNFCCDQDVVYDPTSNSFFWSRLGSANPSGVSTIMLDVLKGSDASDLCEYAFAPTDLNSAFAGSNWDQPLLSLSTQYLYITVGRLGPSDIIRLPLSKMASCGPIPLTSFDSSFSRSSAVAGASDIMYWASHISNNQLRVYWWPDNSNTVSWNDITHPAYTPTGGNGQTMICSDPAGGNACDFLDDSILAGWVANNLVGFAWSVAQGSGFAFPYIDIVTVNQGSMTYSSNPQIWSTNVAFVYASLAPNSNGQVGMSLVYSGGSNYPSMAVGILGGVGGEVAGSPILNTVLISATQGAGVPAGCTLNHCRWGDYVKVRYPGSGDLFSATGFTIQGGNSEARYYTFSASLAFGPLESLVTNVSCVGLNQANACPSSDFVLPFCPTGCQVVAGSPVTVTAMAVGASAYQFSRWSTQTGLAVSVICSTNTCMFPMPANTVTLTAIFVPTPVVVTTYVAGEGTVSPSCSPQVHCLYTPGSLASFVETPVPNWQFVSWTLTGAPTAPSCIGGNRGITCAFNMPDNPVTVTANFAACPNNSDCSPPHTAHLAAAKIALSPTSGPDGTIVSFTGSGFIQTGDSCHITSQPKVIWTGPSSCTVLNGDVRGTFTISAYAPVGTYTIVIVGTDGESASATFTVTPTLYQPPSP